MHPSEPGCPACASPSDCSGRHRSRGSAIRRTRLANRLSLGLIVGFFAMETTRRLVVHGHFDVESLGDFAINLARSQQTLEFMTYPEHFYYPVPFLILQDALAGLGLPLASLLWIVGVIASGIGVLWMSLAMLGARRHPLRWVLALAAMLPVIYFVQWDLRAGNSNLIVLALVLLALRLSRIRRAAAAGAALSVAIALKLYGAVLIPYLVWRREWRFAAATGVGLAVLFLALPALRLGSQGAASLTSAWLSRVLHPGDPLALPDYFKPLDRSLLLSLASAPIGEPSARAWTSGEVRALTWVLQGLWLAAIAWQLARSRRWGEAGTRLYADATALLLLPLPFSPTFQPHHAVVLWLTALWMVRVAAEPEEAPARRIAAVAVLATAGLLVKGVDGWPARALAIQGALALHLGGLLALPPRESTLPSRAQSAPAPSPADA